MGTLPEQLDATVPAIGATIAGKYLVEHVLGAGGMGVVLAARHVQLGQRVAIKVLRHEAARAPESVARFLREGRTVVLLQSVHVVRVIDIGTLDDSLPYIVMEHLAGTDLGARLQKRGPLPVQEAVDYVLQAMEAIAEAHKAGLVHRDLKPANLFLATQPDGSGLVKVLDFGISKVMNTNSVDQSLTITSAVIGSPKYMSPEQLRSSKTVDGRTDIWALGIILYELLTGRTPYEAETLTELCAKIAADPPVKLREWRPDLPAAFESVVMSCVERNVSRRPQTVGELAVALRPFAAAESRQSIESILRIEAKSGSSASTEDGPIDAPPPGGEDVTTGVGIVRDSDTLSASRRSRTRVIVLSGALAVVAVTAFSVIRYHRAAPAPAKTAVAPRVPSDGASAVSATLAPVVVRPTAAVDEVAPSTSVLASPAKLLHVPRALTARPSATSGAPSATSAPRLPRDVMFDRK